MSADPLQMARPARQAATSSAQSPLKRKRAATANSATLPPSPTSFHDSVLTIELPAGKRMRCDTDDRADSRFACASDNAAYIASPPSSPASSDSPDAADAASPPIPDAQPRSDSVASAPLSAPPPSVSTPPVAAPPVPTPSIPDLSPEAVERVQDIVQYQFGYEILLKHNELRLIEQEMAKCQVALEQLRRCHLIPYPTACPTPQQMLDIASGRGAAVRPRPGAPVPKWAAPFGVVDGPYARHYAKWLIPDPVFDGPLPNWPGLGSAPSGRSKSAATAEARAMRNQLHNQHLQLADAGAPAGRGRPSRGLAGQKLHALSNGYPQPKDKAGPCVLRRSDGKVVKLVCLDCHRENFSSTQGFINHCRIAHKRDFKSHEEAAVHCGHPVDVDVPVPSTKKSHAAGAQAAPSAKPASTTTATASGSGSGSGSGSSASVTTASAAPLATVAASLRAPAPATTPIPGHVYPLARNDESVNSLLHHIEDTFKKCTSVRAGAAAAKDDKDSKGKSSAQAHFVASDKAPCLSRFMLEKNLGGDLQAHVDDAKEVMDLDDYDMWAADVVEDEASGTAESMPGPAAPTTAKRMPARQAQASTTGSSATFVSNLDGADGSMDEVPLRRSSSKSMSSQEPDASFHMPGVCTLEFAKKEVAGGRDAAETRLFLVDEMDVDLSPNTIASNNAPSLVSDDGEYDDSDDGSASDTSDTDLESMSDVAEINVAEDEDQAQGTPQPLHHHRNGAASAAAMKLKKDDAKHVSFVNPVTGTDKAKQPQHQQR